MGQLHVIPGQQQRKISKILITLFLSVLGIGMIVPFAWMISTSMKVEMDVFKFPIEWIPKRMRVIENYREVWMGQNPFALYYLNSIKVTVVTTAATLLIAMLGAYGFTRIKFAGRDKLFLLYIATLVIPEQVTLLPRFLIFKWTGIFDTHICLIFNSMFSVTAVFMLRQFMLAIPVDFSESARIDGAGHLQIFWRIIVPLSKPAIATLGILKFIWTWNDYQNPLVFLTDSKKYTIQLGVKMFSDAYGDYYSLIMAAAVSATIPLFIIFFIGQKQIIEGITLGGLKG